MAGKLNKFQTRTFEAWSDRITKDNHLGRIFQLQPQKATNMMVTLFAYQNGKTLDTLLSRYPTKEFDTDDEYTWEVIGSSQRNIPLVEARDCDGNTITAATKSNVGINGEPFFLVFAEDWFHDQDVIVGNLNEIYPIRVLGEGRAEGTNTIYKVELTP